MPITHASKTITVETYPGTGPNLLAEIDSNKKDRILTTIRAEDSTEVKATVSQHPDASTQIHFLQAKGGFFAILNTDRLTYLALPGSQIQLPDTLLNLPGDLPPRRLNPGYSSKKRIEPQQVTDQAMILGAGLASRFVPVSGDLTGFAKPSVPLVGEDSVIVTLARHLQRHGIRKLIVNTYYMPDILKEQLRQVADIELLFIDEDKPSGTAGGLLKALDSTLLDTDKPILIMQGDAVTDADLSALLNTHQQQMPLATIGVKHITDEEVSQMAIVVTDQSGTDSESGYVQSFKEKPSLAEAEDSRLASIGFYVLSPDVYTEFVTWGKAQWEKSGEFDYAFDFFPTLLKAHPNEIYAFMIPQPFYWSDIGRPDQYIATVRDIYEDKLQLGQTLQPERYYENGIIFWENAKEQAVLENTILKGNLIVFNRRS